MRSHPAGINHTSFPSILLGTQRARLEGSGRLAVPAVWKRHFPQGDACLVTSKLGALPCKMLFPHLNALEVLGQIDDLKVREATARSFNIVPVDRQGRLVIYPEKEGFPRDVTLLGSLSHLKIVETALAVDLTAGDGDLMYEMFRD